MATELARLPCRARAEVAAGLRPWDNTLISPPQTGDGVHGVGADLTHPHLPLMLRHNRDRAESRCSQRSGELSLTHSSGSNWVRLSPEATEMTASGEADSPLVRIQVLLWLRELSALGGEVTESPAPQFGSLCCAIHLFSPGLSNSFDFKGANTWSNHRADRNMPFPQAS